MFDELRKNEGIEYVFLFPVWKSLTVVGANLCAPRLLELKGKGIKGMGGVGDKEAYTLHNINIISQLQYFVARCLGFYVGNVFGLYSIFVCFLSTHKLVT
jgi:hypothetical protein